MDEVSSTRFLYTAAAAATTKTTTTTTAAAAAKNNERSTKILILFHNFTKHVISVSAAAYSMTSCDHPTLPFLCPLNNLLSFYSQIRRKYQKVKTSLLILMLTSARALYLVNLYTQHAIRLRVGLRHNTSWSAVSLFNFSCGPASLNRAAQRCAWLIDSL